MMCKLIPQLSKHKSRYAVSLLAFRMMAQVKPQMPEPRAFSPIPSGTRSILRPGYEAVAYHIPTSPSTSESEILKTTISLPRRSAWISGLHFHARHTEYLRLVKGAIFVELNGATKLISALAGGEVDLGTGHMVREGLIIEVPR
jgi:mannose-6-phosphate isomerase-like protein (cupin superfamily)